MIQLDWQDKKKQDKQTLYVCVDLKYEGFLRALRLRALRFSSLASKNQQYWKACV